jgi:hypothetical protein
MTSASVAHIRVTRGASATELGYDGPGWHRGLSVLRTVAVEIVKAIYNAINALVELPEMRVNLICHNSIDQDHGDKNPSHVAHCYFVLFFDCAATPFGVMLLRGCFVLGLPSFISDCGLWSEPKAARNAVSVRR